MPSMRRAPCRLLFSLCLIAHIATCYVVPRRVASFARLRIGTPRHGAVAARLLPEPVEKLLPAAARDDQASVAPLWKAVRQCYATEEAALAALRVNPALVYPWASSAAKIKGSYAVIVELCGKEAAIEVITKNPGALGNDPVRLRASSADDILSAARLAAALGAVQAPLAAIAVVSLGVVALAPDAERFAAVARPTIGALGAGAFVAAAALAAYVGSRRQSES